MTQMSKGVTHRSTSAGVGRAQAVAQLTLKEIRQSIPTECFVKSPSRSLYYLCRDSSIFLALGGGMFMAMRSPEWATMHPAAAGALLMAYWMASGFIMWCMFVVGHDCGHGSFSSSWLLNTVCGHLMHAPLMVPYHAWAESHRRHHLYHNHYTRDYSFPWFTSEDLKAATASVAHKIRVTFPFTGFFMYLAGIPDGGHWLPFGGRLWEHATFRRYLRGLVSSVSVGLFLFTLGTATNWDTWFAFRLYGGCWLWFSFWLVTVTYLQHHDEETLVYTNDDWTFLRGAFQTIDRECASCRRVAAVLLGHVSCHNARCGVCVAG